MPKRDWAAPGDETGLAGFGRYAGPASAQKQKIPFMLPAGDDDAGAVSFRYRRGAQKNGVPVADAIDEIVAAVESRAQV